MVLFVAHALLLGLMLIGVLLLNISRRKHRQARIQQQADPLPDPWRESAARLDPREDNNAVG